MKKIIDFIMKIIKLISDIFTKKDKESVNEVKNDSTDNVLGAITPKAPVYQNVKILIDNGHGINTGGKRSPYSFSGVEPKIPFLEYEWNREIAKRIVDELLSEGFNAELIVTETIDISLSERANRVNLFCDEYGKSNVIFVSVHANAVGNGTKWMTAKGWCAYTTKGKTKSDTLSEYFYKEAEKNFEGRKIRTEMSDGDKDWESNFYVIHKTKCPAILTENFFYDNVDDVTYILSDEGKRAVVKTHVDAIINYIKDTY